jgi:hypothetical protein
VSRFVLDNTVTMARCFNDEATPFTETLLSRLSSLTDSAIVPALWLYEVVNVTGLAVRKGRVTEDKARAFLDSLDCPKPGTSNISTDQVLHLETEVAKLRLCKVAQQANPLSEGTDICVFSEINICTHFRARVLRGRPSHGRVHSHVHHTWRLLSAGKRRQFQRRRGWVVHARCWRCLLPLPAKQRRNDHDDYRSGGGIGSGYEHQ